MPPPITPNNQLTPEEAEVEAAFSAAIQADPESFVHRYNVEFGRWIDTDRARELCSAYRESEAARTRWSRATYRPAKALADEIYRRHVQEAGPAAERRILFTSGGTGVGKSTALSQVLGGGTLAASPYYLLVDGTLSDWKASREKIRQALTRGFRLQIVHVHRALAETARMVVHRAQTMGRVVTLDNIATTHFRSRQVLFKLIEEFEGYSIQFKVRVFENVLGQPPRPISLADLRAVPGGSVEEMRAEVYALYHREFGELASNRPIMHAAFLQAGSRR